MKCPKCGTEAPEGTEACPKCNVIFSKLEERAIRNALASRAAEKESQEKHPSSPMPRLFAMFLVTAALYFFLEHDRRSKLAAANLRAQEAAAAAQPAVTETRPAAAPAAIEDPWKFEGRVLDLLRDKPVSGVKLVFSAQDKEDRFSAVTDAAGYYALELKPLEDAGYEVELSHPDYGGKWWDVTPAKLSRKQRYKLSAQPQERTIKEWARHVGRKKAAVKYDFTIFPNALTEEEKKQRQEALPAATP